MIRRTTLAASVALLGLTTGCAAGADRLPPPTIAEIAPLYEDELAAMGVRLTERGGLIDTRSGGYETSPDGTHLALYLAPLEDQPIETYVDGLTELTAFFATDVFDRWPGLESFDVCQEKFYDEPVAPVHSQVNLTRELATSIDWDTTSPRELVALLEETEDAFVHTSPVLERALTATS